MKTKHLLLIVAVCAPVWSHATGIESVTASPDTTLFVEGKKVEIRDNTDRVKVRVYDVQQNGRIEENELVFEGHYRNGQNHEKRKYAKTITISLPSWSGEFDPHWAGFAMGFANIADGDLHINDINGVSLESGKSLEFVLNLLEYDFRLSRHSEWAFVTGLGLRWSRYRVDGNEYFKRVDGQTMLLPAEEGIDLIHSKLNVTYLTIPFLLEWQNLKRNNSGFFFSAGIVGAVKTASSSRIAYRNERGKKEKHKVDKGLYLRPVCLDFLVQAGYKGVGFYAKYTPMGLFEGDKGPKLHPVSIGAQLHF